VSLIFSSTFLAKSLTS